jgi:NitT/TauT family transport system substrate-binding protein
MLPAPATQRAGDSAQVTSQSAPPDDINFRTDTVYRGPHAPYLLGIEAGIFEKYGIQLNIAEGSGSGNVVQLIANRDADFGYADGGAMIQGIAQGARLKQVMGVLQTSPYAIVSLPEADIVEPADLEGRTCAGSAGSAPELLFDAFARIAGFDSSKVNIVQVDIQSKTTLLLQGEVDCTWTFVMTQVPLLEYTTGKPINTILYADYGLRLISNGIVTNTALIEENPDLVRRFVAATVEAYQMAQANPEAAVDAFMKYVPDATREVVAKQLIETFKLLHTPNTAGKPIGCYAEADWATTIDYLVEYAELENAPAASEVFTNEFLPHACD